MSDETSWQNLINQEMSDLEHRVRRVEDLLAAQAAVDADNARVIEARTERWRWLIPTVLSAAGVVALVLSLHLF